jgi:hypothetical protein
MRIVIGGLVVGSTLGLVAATAASRYGSAPVTAVISEQRTQVILPDADRQWDICRVAHAGVFVTTRPGKTRAHELAC